MNEYRETQSVLATWPRRTIYYGLFPNISIFGQNMLVHFEASMTKVAFFDFRTDDDNDDFDDDDDDDDDGELTVLLSMTRVIMIEMMMLR